MIRAIWRYLMGYIIVELKGNALERLLNKINNAGIILWDIKRINKGVRFKMRAKEYHHLRILVRYRKCTVRIYKKKGLPFIKFRTFRRKAMVVGVILFFILFQTLTSFLWFIEIEGYKRIKRSEIEEVIRETGIKQGIFLDKVDLAALEQNIKTKLHRVSWVDASLDGTRLQVKIVEKQLIDKSGITDIIASEPGVITQLMVFKGKSLVEEGETVKKGQLLIKAASKYQAYAETDWEGNLPPYLTKENNDKVEAAKGIIKAKVWYEGYGEAPLKIAEERLTGKKEKSIKFKIGSKKFHISGPRQVDYQHYKTKKETKSLSLWRNLPLPIEIIKVEYQQTAIYQEERSWDAAKFLAKERAMENILNSLSSNAIITQSKEFIIDDKKKEDNIVRVKVLVEVEKDIAKPVSRKMKEEK